MTVPGDWEDWEFTPQPDLTAYELALIMKSFSREDGGPIHLGAEIRIGKTDTKFATELFARHFTKKENK